MRFYLVATLATMIAANDGFTAEPAPMPRLVKPIACEIAVVWQTKIAYLPDITRNGEKIAGITGQFFLFGPKLSPVPATGKLVVEIFNAPKTGEPMKLGTWTLDKNTLAKLRVDDEKFGECYSLFLPWPDFNPEITQVRLRARFEPECGPVLFARASMLSFESDPRKK